MRVVSSLADIDFAVGEIRREDGALIVTSSEDSTLETVVTITAQDACSTLWRFIKSPSTWLFVASLPFAGRSGQRGSSTGDAWDERRAKTGLNKPW